jgi:hypothetical protein
LPSHWFGLIELLLVFGLILGWAGWQWWGWRKWRRQQALQDKHEQAQGQPVPPNRDGPGT